MPIQYVFLAAAIISEVIGTSALAASDQFSKLIPSVIVVIAYGLAFYFLGLTLKFMPVGIVYAIWAGLGIALIALVGWVLFGQTLDLAAIAGITLIVAGVVVINLFSSSAHS
ncbi:MAG: QacE family quaternary ammonium compound efflux SMR transporter [Rhodobacteraceae bacterium]|nr:QacE family quaternary ammonium compound efflux SMR transporter [Paracoccaceae bacterium]